MVAAGLAEGHEESSAWPIAACAALAATSLAAARIHFRHGRALLGVRAVRGVLLALALLQALWAVGLVLSPSRWLLGAGLVGNLAVVAWSFELRAVTGEGDELEVTFDAEVA